MNYLKLLMTLVVGLFGANMSAQILVDNLPDYTPCGAPETIGKAEIYFDNYFTAFLELSDQYNGSLSLRPSSGAEGGTFPVIAGQMVANLPLGQDYYAFLTDDCGQQINVAVFDGTETDNGGTIKLTPRMFELAMTHNSAETDGLFLDVLETSNAVSEYEKMGFIQQFYLDGGHYPTTPDLSTSAIVSDIKQGVLTGGYFDPCQCKFLEFTPVISPGYVSYDHGIVFRKKEEGRVDWENDAGFDWVRKTKGPAKGHHLVSGGYWAGSEERQAEHRDKLNDDGYGNNRAEITIGLKCENLGSVPTACDCEKELQLFYMYESRVTTMANLRGPFYHGSKYAEAYSEDLSMLMLRQDGVERLLDGGNIRVVSTCEREVNPEYFGEIFDVLTAIIPLFDTITGSWVDPVTGIVNEVEDLFTTDYYSNNSCSDPYTDENEVLMEGDTIFNIYPNDVMTFALFSFTHQLAGGKNSWISWANLSSSYYLGVRVPELSASIDNCCTEEFGSWRLGALEGRGPVPFPNSSYPPETSQGSLYNLVGSKLTKENGWDNLECIETPFVSECITQISSEFGYAEKTPNCYQEGLQIYSDPTRTEQTLPQDRQGWQVIQPAPAVFSNDPNTQATETKLVEEIKLVDLLGRTIQLPQQAIPWAQIDSYLQQDVQVPITGIYGVQARLSTGEVLAKKVFLTTH